LNNSLNDPSGAGNSLKLPTAPATNAAGTASSSGPASGQTGGVNGGTLSGGSAAGANPSTTTGVSTNRAGGAGGRIDGVANPLPPVPGDEAIKAENAKVDAKVKSICKGC
jgi:hypothetical protein